MKMSTKKTVALPRAERGSDLDFGWPDCGADLWNMGQCRGAARRHQRAYTVGAPLLPTEPVLPSL